MDTNESANIAVRGIHIKVQTKIGHKAGRVQNK